MKLTLGSSGFKQFQKILRFLAKTSDEIHISAHPDQLVLKALNSNETAYATAKISECFFLHYNMTNNRITPEENEECNNCIVSSKPLVFTFKSAKNVISCTISIEKERLTLTVKKAKGMETINSVHILDYEELEKFELNTTDNSTIVTHCSLFTQMLKNIPKKLNDLSVAMFQDRIELSNHIVHPDKDVQTVRMNFIINRDELVEYNIKEDHRLIISTDNFMALVEAGQCFSDDLTLTFIKNGKPMIARTVSSDKFIDLEMVLSTMREETLRKNRKPPEAQSYRDLVVSYIENNEKKKREREEFEDFSNMSRRNLSETEMKRVMSPTIDSVDTFKSLSNRPKQQEIFKKPFSTLLLSNNKRAKVVGNCSQEELNQVSKILEDLENYEDDDDTQCKEDGSHNILENMIKIPIRLDSNCSQMSSEVPHHSTTSQNPANAQGENSNNNNHHASQSQLNNKKDQHFAFAASEFESSENNSKTNRSNENSSDECENVSRNGSIGFNIAEMNFPSEEILKEQEQELSKKTEALKCKNQPKLPFSKKQKMKIIKQFRRDFLGDIHSKKPEKSPPGNIADHTIFVPNSDSENDDE